MSMNHFKKMVCILYAVLLPMCGCQSKLLTVYKIDIQQGNVLKPASIEKIKLGTSKKQVRFILGSPLIVDSFHPDRWDYVYLLTPGYGERQYYRLTITFDRDEVIDITSSTNNAGVDIEAAENGKN